MAQPVTPLGARRALFIASLFVVSLLAISAWHFLEVSLRPDTIYTGLVLLLLVFGLTFFNARKKLPFLPLVGASTWLQVHIYAGWFCVLIFLLHIHFRFPSGTMELTLAAIFCVVIVSGIFGLYISRSFPSRMALSGEALLYERMPALRCYIQENVENLIRKAESETQSSTLGDFYVERLHRFFASVPSAFRALRSADSGLQALLGELNAVSRYLNEQELEIAHEIRDWIETKQNLDFQYAAQRLLKLWLFVHIPFTYSLIVLGVVHGLVAGLYTGGF